MSVDYSLVCHKHKEQVDVCSDGLSGPLLQCDRSLAAFCITHRNCELNIVAEYEDAFEQYKTWNKATWKILLDYEKE